jgi:type IV pilus assembly protein PilQ
MVKMIANYKDLWKVRCSLFTVALLFVMVGCASKPPAKPAEAPPPESAAQTKTVHRIAVSEDEVTALLTLYANQPLTYTAVKHQFPLGVVLYLPDTGLEGIQESYTPESSVIKSIQTSVLKRERPSSRIEVRLNEDVPYEVTRADNRILVSFKRPVAMSEEGTAVEEPAVEEPIEVARQAEPEVKPKAEPEVQVAERPKPEAEPQKVAEEDKGLAWVNRIEFEMLERGQSRLIVGTTKKVRYETQRSSDNRLLFKVFDARLPEFQKRPLITTRFKSAIDRVLPIQTPNMGDTAIIAIEFREAVPYKVQQDGGLCFIDFDASSEPWRPMPEVERPPWVQAMKETEAAVVREVAQPPEKPTVTETGQAFTGERISLDFQDADIHNIFRILHEVSGKNFVIGDDVKGKVTLKLVNVPWDQVLDLVLKMNKLGTVVEGNIVRIARLSTLEAENKALAAKMQAEQTAEEQEPLMTEYIPINYAEAATIQKHLVEIKSPRGKISVDERTNMIIMNDVRAAVGNARDVVKRLDVVTPQVVIEARIVEANTDFSREIGIMWGAQYEDGDGFGVGGATTQRWDGGLLGDYNVILPPAAATSGIGFTFQRLGSAEFTLNANLLAMQEEGKGRIISTPKILTLDNKEAYIEQGLEIPYQVLEEGSYSLKWAKAVLRLEVTPHITMDRRIAMKIIAKKDAPDRSIVVQGAPAIDKKEAGTELMVNNGDTIVIGGIITREETLSNKGVPGLSKLPLLGWLFKSEAKDTTDKELLIFVTPTIVELQEAR